jgi:hypothetical protein
MEFPLTRTPVPADGPAQTGWRSIKPIVKMASAAMETLPIKVPVRAITPAQMVFL